MAEGRSKSPDPTMGRQICFARIGLERVGVGPNSHSNAVRMLGATLATYLMSDALFQTPCAALCTADHC